jgi:hypothetical protein
MGWCSWHCKNLGYHTHPKKQTLSLDDDKKNVRQSITVNNVFMDTSIKWTRPLKIPRIAQVIQSNPLCEIHNTVPVLPGVTLFQCMLHGDHLSESTPLHEDAEIGEGWEAEDEDHSPIFIEDEVEEETAFNT